MKLYKDGKVKSSSANIALTKINYLYTS